MMNINLDLKVATVDFLDAINGKEIVLSSTIQNDIGYLLIYPKTPIYVHTIDDIFDNCDHDVVGIADVEVGFDEKNPFKYPLGTYLDNTSPIVFDHDLMFMLVNGALIQRSLINEDNSDSIVLSKKMLYGIHGVHAIVYVSDDTPIEIYELDTFEVGANVDAEKEFIDWINNDYPFVINKLDKNKDVWQDVLDDLKSKKAILNPRSAFQLAQVKFEYDETKRSLNQHKDKITIPGDALHKLNQLLNGGIVMINEIINVDFNNGGNLGIFIESMAKEIPIDAEMVNIGDDMIEIDFNQYK